MALPSRAKGKATEKTQYLPALKDEDVPEPDPSIQKKQLFKTKESTEEKKAEEKTDVRAAITLPDRPGIGQPNRRSPCALLTNSFTMDLKHVDEIYIYEISFDDRYQPGSNRRARRLFQLMLEQHRPVTDRAATDYRQILVSVRQLTQYNTDTNIQVVYYEAGEQPPVPPHVVAAAYYIKVHYTKTLSLQALRQYLNNPSPPGGNPYGEKEEALNVLNLLMNRAPGQDLAIHKIGKTKIFNTSQPVEPPCLLQGGLEAYVGFEKSVRTSEAGCLLNVNATRSAFYLAIGVDQLIKLWAQCASVPPNRIPQASYTNAELVVLNRFLKGVRVRATYHPRRFYSIWRLARAPNPQTYPTAANIRFDIQEEGQPTRSTTVLAYFRDKYGNDLHPRVSPDDIIVDVGNDNHAIYIPAKLLEVLPGNYYGRVLSGDQQVKMIEFACRPAQGPRGNQHIISTDGLRLLGVRASPLQSLPRANFGIDVDHRMLEVTGYHLNGPWLQYRPSEGTRGQAYIEPDVTSDGSWTLHNQLFIKPCGGVTWSWMEVSVPNNRCNDEERDDFLWAMDEYLRRYCSFDAAHFLECASGTQSRPYHFPASSADALLRSLQFFKKEGTAILFVILSSKDSAIYARLKKIAEIDVGIQTICIVRHENWRPGKFTMKKNKKVWIRELKCDADPVVNMLHKVNLQLDGRNLVLDSQHNGRRDLFTSDTMILGADVTHPGVGSIKDCPSVAAVVGSLDPWFNLYTASLRCQTSKQESIAEFGAMVEERLDVWKQKNESRTQGQPPYPKQIIIFRDGVSESQFQMVLEYEWPQIKQAIRKKYDEIKQGKPKVMLLCVLKRHSRRFYPKDQSDRTRCDANGNPRCGLVVDRQVTYEKGYDFYLQSHACIKGTARPAHYVVLVDEINLNRDIVQKEIYNHCFLFARCPKAVGIHPAARYADRACERGRFYLWHAFNNPHTTFNLATAPAALNVHADLAGKMFFI